MSLVSNTFILFVAATILVYYLVPGKLQWIVLLVFSYLYYIAGGVQYLLFLLFSTAVTYGGALLISRLRADGKEKTAKRILLLALLLNLGMLGVLKYSDFVIENINAVLHLGWKEFRFLLPLGISFYTFQSTGYLLDVWWKRTEPERNPGKYALFVSFFPQLLQGPIGKFSRLEPQLCTPHKPTGRNLCRGFERILWGYFKKMIADWAVVFVDAVFDDPGKLSGISIFAVIMYSIQLYADFSGGIDVVIGIAEMMGITLDENFTQPYLATSLADFWHRWHISLGNWMKDYVFYPLSLSRWMGKFGKWAKQTFGKKTGRGLPICISNILVFLVVGIWHGAAWKYVVYGLYNGIIIGVSGMLAGAYRSWKKALHINSKAAWSHVFMVLRTLVIVNIYRFFDRADTVRGAWTHLVDSFTHWNPSLIMTIPAGRGGTAFTPYALLIIACGCIVLFIVSILKEKGWDIRERIAALPLPVSAAIYFCLLLSIGLFGSTAAARGFIYAQF